MSRLFGFAFLGGIFLIVTGAYHSFIEFGASVNPTTVLINDLEKALPGNRHLIITGGIPMFKESVTFYKTKRHTKVAGSEIHFIPLKDAQLAKYISVTPTVLLMIREAELNKAETNKDFDPNNIQCVRLTRWDTESLAEESLSKRYGDAAVKNMIIVEYKRKIQGVGSGLGEMGMGAAIIIAVTVAGMIRRHR